MHLTVFTLYVYVLSLPIKRMTLKLFVPQMKVHVTKQTLHHCCSSNFCVSLLVFVWSGVRAIRAFEDESKARLGVVECAKHELLQPFSVLHEKEGEALVPQSYN